MNNNVFTLKLFLDLLANDIRFHPHRLVKPDPEQEEYLDELLGNV